MPARDDFVIRPYAASDRPALEVLLRDVWSRKREIEADVRNRWWWQHAAPPIYVATDPGDHSLAGLCAWLSFDLRIGGREIPAAWFVDFYVRAGHQGRGLGRRLTEAVQQQFPLTASLSQTDQAYRVFENLGWSPRVGASVYMHPKPVRWLFRKTSDPSGLRMSVADAGPAAAAADLNALWTRVRDSYGAIGVRDSRHVSRRYQHREGREYILVACHRGNECAGWMVARLASAPGQSGQGLIVDYLIGPDDDAAFAALLSRAVRELVDRGAARIYAMAATAAARRVLQSCAFLSPDTPVLGRRLQSQRKWLTFVTREGAPAIDPARWYLTLGDCDLDLAW